MKILPGSAELFCAYRQTDRRPGVQTDMTKLIVAFHNFANMLKNCGLKTKTVYFIPCI
jgi:hypothetical protein